MSFANLPLLGVLAGLAALAAGLFVLQRLRVRHRDVVVPTTLFWQEAVEEARARVLVRRFRHPLAYLLVLLLAGTLWLAFAGPVLERDEEVDHIVLFDSTAAWMSEERFAAALELLEREVAALPRGRTTVRRLGSSPATVLAAGEHPELLAERLRESAPGATRAGVADELDSLVELRLPRPLAITLIAEEGLDPARNATLPPGWSVRHVALDRPRSPNRGLVELGLREAASGAYEEVDVLAVVSGDGPVEAGLVLELDERPLELRPAWVEEQGSRRYLLSGLPARGGLLRVALPRAEGSPGDGIAADDSASLRLPLRRRVRVLVSSTVPAALRKVLALDPAVSFVTDGADLVVRSVGEADGGAIPALELASSDAQSHAFTLVHGGSNEAGVVLRAGIERLGLDEIDAMDLARSLQRPIAVGVELGATPAVRVWSELLSERYDFVDSLAFPLLVARAVRWLGGEEELLLHAASGEELPGPAAQLVDADGRRYDSAGAAFVPPHAGSFRSADGASLEVALGAPEITAPAPRDPSAAVAAAANSALDATALLALGALALLVLEWALLRTGRIP